MKHISIGGLDVSRIGLVAMSMSGYSQRVRPNGTIASTAVRLLFATGDYRCTNRLHP